MAKINKYRTNIDESKLDDGEVCFRADGGFEAKESLTHENPALGYHKLFCKSDGWYTLDSNGNEVKLGTGTAGGGNSYFPSGW
jgi:hypothetical protein